ncbi:MAG: class II aldolase/adducin family protein [Bacteroidetes bacterium]|nr:class II aldolase/adducin family protein [Bacteroidota bacterium]
MTAYTAQKKEVAHYMRRLYRSGLTTPSGGNISLRINDEVILITASQTDKGRIKSEQIGQLRADGKNLTPGLRLSMESGMHLAVYKARPDVSAIVHAHPVAATSFAASHRDLNCNLIGETRALLGQPLIAPYALMGSEELAQEVARHSRNTNALLMANHGAITLGTTLLEAYDRMELLESCARINILSEILGGAKPISPGHLQAIDRLIHP